MVQMDAVEEIESRRSESDVDGGEARERSEIASGRVVPLNSRRLTAAYLKQVAETLELPTSGAADQLRQLIKGKGTWRVQMSSKKSRVWSQSSHCYMTVVSF